MLNRLFLILLQVIISKVVIASDPDLKEETSSSKKSSSSLMLVGIPKIHSVTLITEKSFEWFNLKTFPDISQLQNNNTIYDLEEIKRRCREGEESKSYKFAAVQNKIPKQDPYQRSARLLEAGEIDRSHEDDDEKKEIWLRANILELKVLILKLHNLMISLNVNFRTKEKVLERYQQLKTTNQGRSSFNLFGYWEWWQNYYFSGEELRKYYECFEFCCLPKFQDEELRLSREYHKKLDLFKKRILRVSSPLSNEVSFKSSVNFTSMPVDNGNKLESISKAETSDNKPIMITPKDFREKLKLILKAEIPKKRRLKSSIPKVTESEDKLYEVDTQSNLTEHDQIQRNELLERILFTLLHQFQGKKYEPYQSRSSTQIGGLLGEYQEMHRRVQLLDNDLLDSNLIQLSFYSFSQRHPKLAELSNSRLHPLTSDLEIEQIDKKIQRELVRLYGGEQLAKAPCYLVQKEGNVFEMVPEEEWVRFEKSQKLNDTKKYSIEKEPFVKKTKKFIIQSYQNFSSHVFILGLSPNVHSLLLEALNMDPLINNILLGSVPIIFGGDRWVISFKSKITSIDLSGQHLASPAIAPHADGEVKRRIEARFKAYKEELTDYQKKISEVEKELTAQRGQIKTFRDLQGTAVGTLLVLASKTSSNELETLQTSLNSEVNNSADLEREQLLIVDTLSRYFDGDEVFPLAQEAGDDEATSPLNRMNKVAKKLKQELEMRERKENDTGKKQELNLIGNLLENVSRVIEHMSQIEKKQEEKERLKRDCNDKERVLHFYAHLQAMSWQPQQRIKISFQPIQDVDQVEKNETRVMHLIESAYQALFTDIFEQKSQKDTRIGSYKPNNTELGIIIDLGDLQAPLVRSLML